MITTSELKFAMMPSVTVNIFYFFGIYGLCIALKPVEFF